MFGKLTLDAIPLQEPIVVVTLIGIILGGLAVVGALTYFRKWKWLWSEWLTSVDHKKIGIMLYHRCNGHDVPWLCRCHYDEKPTGTRLSG